MFGMILIYLGEMGTMLPSVLLVSCPPPENHPRPPVEIIDGVVVLNSGTFLSWAGDDAKVFCSGWSLLEMSAKFMCAIVVGKTKDVAGELTVDGLNTLLKEDLSLFPLVTADPPSLTVRFLEKSRTFL